jgi:hypothetical protein
MAKCENENKRMAYYTEFKINISLTAYNLRLV